MKNQTIKQDSGKPDYTLVLGRMPRAIEAMVKVREYGHGKYSRIAKESGVPFDSESWRRVDPARYLASATRHLMAALRGERRNEEDGGVNHLAQAMIDLGFVIEIEAQDLGSAIPHPGDHEPGPGE